MNFVCEECLKRERTTGSLLKSICQLCGREVIPVTPTPQKHSLCDPCAARHNRCKVCGKMLSEEKSLYEQFAADVQPIALATTITFEQAIETIKGYKERFSREYVEQAEEICADMFDRSFEEVRDAVDGKPCWISIAGMYKTCESNIIPYGTKIIYHGVGGYKDCKCHCGHYNAEDDTYNVYHGWEVTHVPKNKIEIYEW